MLLLSRSSCIFPNKYSFCSSRISIAEYHLEQIRFTGTPGDHPVPSKQGQIKQVKLHRAFSSHFLRDIHSTSSADNLCQCLTTPTVKSVLALSCISTCAHREELTPSSLPSSSAPRFLLVPSKVHTTQELICFTSCFWKAFAQAESS